MTVMHTATNTCPRMGASLCMVAMCISYLTIEHRDEIPERFHAQMGDWVFGCDICQQVCPYNQDAPVTKDFPARPPGPRPSLEEIANWSDDDYRQTLEGSAIKRAKLGMLNSNMLVFEVGMPSLAVRSSLSKVSPPVSTINALIRPPESCG